MLGPGPPLPPRFFEGAHMMFSPNRITHAQLVVSTSRRLGEGEAQAAGGAEANLRVKSTPQTLRPSVVIDEPAAGGWRALESWMARRRPADEQAPSPLILLCACAYRL